jgi:hypothetical protein
MVCLGGGRREGIGCGWFKKSCLECFLEIEGRGICPSKPLIFNFDKLREFELEVEGSEQMHIIIVNLYDHSPLPSLPT